MVPEPDSQSTLLIAHAGVCDDIGGCSLEVIIANLVRSGRLSSTHVPVGIQGLRRSEELSLNSPLALWAHFLEVKDAEQIIILVVHRESPETVNSATCET